MDGIKRELDLCRDLGKVIIPSPLTLAELKLIIIQAFRPGRNYEMVAIYQSLNTLSSMLTTTAQTKQSIEISKIRLSLVTHPSPPSTLHRAR